MRGEEDVVTNMSDERNSKHYPITLQIEGAWPEKMKLSEAHRFLGVSHAKITSLVKTGVIPHERHPLDHRVKLVNKSDLERLMRAWGRH
jgi:hypothetical protein